VAAFNRAEGGLRVEIRLPLILNGQRIKKQLEAVPSEQEA
jgi:hypothetical protein